MILLSNSLPKSGSTLICNYQEDLLAIAGIRNGQRALRKNHNGRFIQNLTGSNLLRLAWLNFLYGNLVVKTHCPPNPSLILFQRCSLSKATYCYRDPRDVILSAIDHGKRSRAGIDKTGAFISFENVLDSIPLVNSMIETFYLWRKIPNTLFIRYEEVMNEPENQLRNMVAFLRWPIDDDEIKKIVIKHNEVKGNAWNFNKGTTCRWKSEMTSEEIEATTRAFLPFLEEMDYEI